MFANNIGFMVTEIVGNLCQFDIQVVGAGDKTSFVAGPVEAENGFEVEAVDLVDGGYLLVFVSAEYALDIEYFQN